MRKKVIEPGTRFGNLLVIKETDPYVQANGKRKIRYLCKCDCGREIAVRSDYLTSGKQIHCFTCGNKTRGMRANSDPAKMIGKKFGKWTVISRSEKSIGDHAGYLCRCECGTESIIQSSSLTSGNSTCCKSCGNKKR